MLETSLQAAALRISETSDGEFVALTGDADRMTIFSLLEPVKPLLRSLIADGFVSSGAPRRASRPPL